VWPLLSLMAETTPSDPVSMFAQYGPLGLMVLGFLTGWIVPGPVAKQKDVEIGRLQALFENEVLPMAKTYAETMAETSRVLDRTLSELARREYERGGGGGPG
jgi:hypothetical protein